MNNTAPFVIAVDTSPLTVLDDPVPADRQVRGTPLRGARPAYESEADGFYTGIWESEVGAWRVSYDEDELCVLLAGRVRLIGDDGQTTEYASGDSFVIRRGFRGIWETLEPLRKIYAISL
jgi:hypothetical protein